MITLNDARRHLRIDGTQDNDEIHAKLMQAQALVMSYVGHTIGTASLEEATPELIDEINAPRLTPLLALDAAVLLVLGELWLNRESSDADPLSPGVKNFLQLFREPGYA